MRTATACSRWPAYNLAVVDWYVSRGQLRTLATR
jgi:hypothetical protein